MTAALRIAAVVLAGGEGRRLGADMPKPLVPVGGKPMIAHVLERLPPSLAPVLISANDEPAFAAFGLPVVRDRFGGRKGPLAGLDAAAAFLRDEAPRVSHLLSLPGDTPFLPGNLAARMILAPPDRPRLARFEGRIQPTVALWPLSFLHTLADFLPNADDLSVMRFVARAGPCETLDIGPSGQAPGGDPFFNVNTPDDLAAARALLGS